MPATNWTEQTLDAATGWSRDVYPPGTQFVLFGGVLMPVDADGNPVPLMDATVWTEATVSATSWTERTVAATSWTESSG